MQLKEIWEYIELWR